MNINSGGTVDGDRGSTGGVHQPRPAAVDLAILIVVIATINMIALRMTARYAGPISALCAVALIAVLIRRRGMRWRDLGMRRPSRWIFAQVPAALVTWLAVSAAASSIAGRWLPRPDTDARFGDLAGNLPATLWWMAIGFGIGGFAEETIFRGYLLNRLEALLPRGAWGSTAAVFLQAFLFGLVHAYNRGLFGLLVIGTVGAVMGAFYLLFRRNLWPVILAHGLGNALGFIVDYLDLG
jgi:membrane protease YdiL (CAAX protease family)